MDKNECFALPGGCQMVRVRTVRDDRGCLSFANAKGELPLDVERVFWIYDVPDGKTRGAHAHKTCDELVFAVCGEFTMVVDDGHVRQRVRMNDPQCGLLIPAGMWCELVDFRPGTVVVVLASQEYDAGGYVNEYEEYLKVKSEE